MKLFLRNLAIKISIGYLVSLSNSVFCAEVVNIDDRLKPNSSVSVCLFASGNEIAEVFTFRKANKGHWFKGGAVDMRETDAYRTNDGYCIYPHGIEKPAKNPGQLVFPCGASGVVGMSGETIKAAALREFEEETGVDLEDHNQNLDYKAYKLEDSQGSFYVLYCRIKGAKDVVGQTKDGLFSMMQANFAEKDARKTPTALLPRKANFEPEPQISHDELDAFGLVNFREQHSITTTCERSRLAYGHLVTLDSKRSRPTKKVVAFE